MSALSDLVTKRHDCVHRNGQPTDNEAVEITTADIRVVLGGAAVLVEQVQKLVDHHKTPDEEIPF